MGNREWKHVLFLITFMILLPSYYSTNYLIKSLPKTEAQSEDTTTKLPNKKGEQLINKNEDISEIKEKEEKPKDYYKPTTLPIKKQPLSDVNKKHPQSFDFSMFMDIDKTYFVQWKTNKTHITFDVQVKTLGWVGLGLSPTGAMTNSDIAVMWIENGELTLQDRFAFGFYEPEKDPIDSQDWIPLYGYENETHTIVGFSRLLDTCDTERDRKITKDTVHLLYAYHSKDPPNGQLMKHEHRGHQSVVFMNGNINFKEPQHEKKLSFSTNGYKIPSENATTYRCFFHQIKDIDKKYYMIASNAEIPPQTNGIVHHIILHLCDSVFTNKNKVKDMLCYEDAHSGDFMRHCFSELLVMLAIGGYNNALPKDIGFPIDKEMNGRWVFLEVHYNNYELKEGLIDNTVLDLYLTDKKPKHEAGQLFFGVLDFSWELLIPPKQKEYVVTSYCSQNCLNNMQIPEEGLNVFLYFLHTHTTGRKVRIRVIRDGQELETTMKDDNYDFNYQVYRELSIPFKIKRGDILMLECTYSTIERNNNNYTIGGFQTSEEMCIGYIYYYPKTNFTICGSLASTPSLVTMLGVNTTMSKTGLSEIITFKRNADSLKKRETVLNEMNTDYWRSEEGVEKLKTIYKNVEYDEVCRYMSIPEIKTGKMPTNFKPYQEKPSTCPSEKKKKTQ